MRPICISRCMQAGIQEEHFHCFSRMSTTNPDNLPCVNLWAICFINIMFAPDQAKRGDLTCCGHRAALDGPKRTSQWPRRSKGGRLLALGLTVWRRRAGERRAPSDPTDASRSRALSAASAARWPPSAPAPAVLSVIQGERSGVIAGERVHDVNGPARQGRAGSGVQGVAVMLSLSR